MKYVSVKCKAAIYTVGTLAALALIVVLTTIIITRVPLQTLIALSGMTFVGILLWIGIRSLYESWLLLLGEDNE